MKRFVLLTCLSLLTLATSASAAPTCDAIEGDAPLYGEEILAFAQTMAPPGCDQAWSQEMRARRNAKPRDGIVVREETWGLLVEETAEGCHLDGSPVEVGTITHLSVRCETWYRCADGATEVTKESSCERAP